MLYYTKFSTPLPCDKVHKNLRDINRVSFQAKDTILPLHLGERCNEKIAAMSMENRKLYKMKKISENSAEK